MTTKKAPKNESKPKPAITISRSRGGGKKKPDLFARLRNTEHPLDNLLPPINESDAQDNDLSGVQKQTKLDAQRNSIETPNLNLTGRPDNQNSDAQLNNFRTSKQEIIGRPQLDNLDVLTPKFDTRTPKSDIQSGVKTSKDKKSDAQENKSTEKKEKRKIWESNRTSDRLALRPNAEILKKFKVFCVEKDFNLTEFFEIAGLKFIELDAQQKDQLGVLTPLDDRRLKMMFKCKPFIINLYLRYNAIFNEFSATDGKKWTARWTPRDDEAAVRYNEISPAIVELGILQTQIQKGFGSSRIQTFKYYTDEIEKVLESGVGDETLEHILGYHRAIWKKQTGREVDLGFLTNRE